jgi:hypothetical protein
VVIVSRLLRALYSVQFRENLGFNLKKITHQRARLGVGIRKFRPLGAIVDPEQKADNRGGYAESNRNYRRISSMAATPTSSKKMAQGRYACLPQMGVLADGLLLPEHPTGVLLLRANDLSFGAWASPDALLDGGARPV